MDKNEEIKLYAKTKKLLIEIENNPEMKKKFIEYMSKEIKDSKDISNALDNYVNVTEVRDIIYEEAMEFMKNVGKRYKDYALREQCQKEGHIFGGWWSFTTADTDLVGCEKVTNPFMPNRGEYVVWTRRCARCGCFQTSKDEPKDSEKVKRLQKGNDD